MSMVRSVKVSDIIAILLSPYFMTHDSFVSGHRRPPAFLIHI